MKEKILTNVRIIDPSQKMDEIGNIAIDEKGKIKSIGKKLGTSKSAEKIDLKGLVAIPGLVDMKAFVGEPGFEYKENFRTLSQAALAGGVTSIVTMPNTKPVIDNVSMVDFIIRRGRDKAKVNLFPCASITRQMEGNQMTEFGLLKARGIIGFSDFGEISSFNVFGEQEHQYGFQMESSFELNDIEYEWAVGYLHGLTDASANHTIIWNFEVEFF